MKKNYAISCPNCKQLVNHDSVKCPGCGMPAPGKLGFINVINRLDLSQFVVGLIGINLFFYGLSLILTSSFGFSSNGFLSFFSPANDILQLLGWAEPGVALSGSYWQLISAAFLHGGAFHILMGMLWLNDLSKIGNSFFNIQSLFIVYIFSAIGGNFLAMNFGESPVVGSSGAIFGLMGVIIAYGYFGKSLHAGMYAFRLGKWALILLVLGFIIPGISNSAHIGGLFTGIVFGYWFAKNPRPNPIFLNLLFFFAASITAYAFFIMLYRVITTILLNL